LPPDSPHDKPAGGPKCYERVRRRIADPDRSAAESYAMKALVWTAFVSASVAMGGVVAGQQLPQAFPPLPEYGYFTAATAEAGPGAGGEPFALDACSWDADVLCPPDECGCCGPLWTVRASAVFMERSSAGFDPVLFDFNFEPGLDLSVIRRLGPCHDIEVRYFGIHGWRSDLEFFGVGLMNRSQLDSTEINLRRQVGCLHLLAGFRWVEFMDHAQIEVPAPPAAVGQNVNNHLYGFQLGADGTLWDNGCRFRLDGFLKGGIYYNHIDRSTFVAVGPPFNLFFETLDSAERTAFVGELGLFGVYQWSDRWALRAGYQMLWLEGIALASELSPSLNTDGIFAHGAVVGAEFTY
jgi:hypothetical protein